MLAAQMPEQVCNKKPSPADRLGGMSLGECTRRGRQLGIHIICGSIPQHNTLEHQDSTKPMHVRWASHRYVPLRSQLAQRACPLRLQRHFRPAIGPGTLRIFATRSFHIYAVVALPQQELFWQPHTIIWQRRSILAASHYFGSAILF